MNARQLHEMNDFATYGTLSHSGTRVARELRIQKNKCASVCVRCHGFPAASAKDFPSSAMRVGQKRINQLSTVATLSEADRAAGGQRAKGEGAKRRFGTHPRTVHAFLELEINIKLTCSLPAHTHTHTLRGCTRHLYTDIYGRLCVRI